MSTPVAVYIELTAGWTPTSARATLDVQVDGLRLVDAEELTSRLQRDNAERNNVGH